MALLHTDGTYGQYVAGAWNGTTKVLTVTATGFTVNVDSGATVWDFGISSDTDPNTGVAFAILPGPAVNTTGDALSAVLSGARTFNKYEPVVIYNPNATAQTTVNYVEYAYATKK